MVPGYGVVGYNGYKFPATYEIKVSSTPVYSESNRTTLKYIDNTLTCSFIYTQELTPRPQPPYTMDNEMEVFRAAIMRPRRDLYISFQGSGLGTNGIFIYPNYEDKVYVSSDNVLNELDFGDNRRRRVPVAEYGYLNEIGGGPLPRILNWEPIGTNKACKVTWAVDFKTLRNPFNDKFTDSGSPNNLFLNFDFDRNFSINEEGIASITTTGFVEIPITFRNFRYVLNTETNELLKDGDTVPKKWLDCVGVSADDVGHWKDPQQQVNNKELLMGFMDSCLPAATPNEYDPLVHGEGFVVKRFDRTLSKSGTRLEFTHVMEEHPSANALFPYTIKVGAKHKMRSSLLDKATLSGKGFFTWGNTVEVSVTIAPGYAQALAFQIFFYILMQRMGIIGLDARIDPENPENKVMGDSGDPRTVLLSLEFEEDIYSRTHSFRAEYTGVYKLDDLLKQSGLFHPMYARKDVNGKYPWEAGYIPYRKGEWANNIKTVYEVLFHENRGYRDAHQPYSFIFDTEYENQKVAIPTNTYVEVNKIEESEKTPGAGEDLIEIDMTNTGLTTGSYSKKASYIAYHNDVEFVEKTRVYPIGIQDSSYEITNYKKSDASSLRNNNPVTAPNLDQFHLYDKHYAQELPDSTVDAVGGGSSYIAIVKGYGVRVNHEVPAPALLAMNNGPSKSVQLNRCGDPVISKTVIGAGDNQLHVTKWEIPYSIPFPLTGPITFDKDVSNELVEEGRLFGPPTAPTPT